jgi:prepilin-type N-terminal cleavage/methylation domain-containing protein
VRRSSAGNERGSTLLEVIIALAILSLIGIGAWTAASVSLRTAARSHARILSGARLLQLDDSIRALAARVRPPYWLPDPAVTLDGGKMRVASLDGDPGKSLDLVFDNGVLALDAGGEPTRFSGLRNASFAPALDADGHIDGIRLELEAGPGTRAIIIARFGGTPIRGLSKP